MDHRYSAVLRGAFADLTLRMQLPHLVGDYLFSVGKITEIDLSLISGETNRMDKNLKLLEIVASRDEDVFLAFRDALMTPEINEKILVDQWFSNV